MFEFLAILMEQSDPVFDLQLRIFFEFLYRFLVLLHTSLLEIVELLDRDSQLSFDLLSQFREHASAAALNHLLQIYLHLCF